MKTQDEIIGAIENIILNSGKDEMEAFQDIAEAYDRYCEGNGLQCATYVEMMISDLLSQQVKGAKAVERVGDAIAEVGGQY